jgi:glyoxylase-like metal-dependent hydrolase (beta-lactamase superfamily II)
MPMKGAPLIGMLCFVLQIVAPICAGAQDKTSKPFVTKLFSHVFMLRGSCNAYLLVSGKDGLLIDNAVPDFNLLKKATGIVQIDWVLHTHYHRDQCSGDLNLRAGKTRIALGMKEQAFFLPAFLKPPFPITLAQNQETDPYVPGKYAPVIKPGIDKLLCDQEVFTWKEYTIRVLGTPGHTEGSLSFAVDVDGKRLLFTGDLIMKGGYIHDLYNMQWQYLENPGIDSALHSLAAIEHLQPDLLLPSHGDIITDPETEINVLVNRLKEFNSCFKFERTPRWNWSGFVQISPHLIQDCGTTTQILIGVNGHALLFDCGTDFTPKRLETAKRMFGFSRVDVIIPSHWHADHMGGIPTLLNHEKAKVWVWEGLAEHLEFPWHFPATYRTDIFIRADRVLKKGEVLVWEGDTLQVFENPVHMSEQMALAVHTDGLKFLLLADGSACDRHGHIRSAIHCYNGISLNTCMIATATSLKEADPYICVPAHSNGFALCEDARDEYMEWAIRSTNAVSNLLQPELQEFYFNPYWAVMYPARIRVLPGDHATIALRIANSGLKPISGRAYFHGYSGVEPDKKDIYFVLSPGESMDYPLSVRIPGKAASGRYVITADLECNGEFFSEYAQGYLECASPVSMPIH